MSTRILLSVLACAVGCSTGLDFGSDVEHKNLTYDQFLTKLGTDGLDPKGASAIDCRSTSTRDGHDEWYALTISPANYDELLERVTEYLSDPQRAAFMAKPTGKVSKESSTSVALPDNWPKPESPQPGWWSPPKNTPVECTRWQLQCETRAKGWFWAYDRAGQRLWIWEWNHQWQRF